MLWSHLHVCVCALGHPQVMVFESRDGWQAFRSALNCPLRHDTQIIGLDGSRYNMSPGLLEGKTPAADSRQLPVRGLVVPCRWQFGLSLADDDRGRMAGGLFRCERCTMAGGR